MTLSAAASETSAEVDAMVMAWQRGERSRRNRMFVGFSPF
jgi:hypothetical protein